MKKSRNEYAWPVGVWEMPDLEGVGLGSRGGPTVIAAGVGLVRERAGEEHPVKFP